MWHGNGPLPAGYGQVSFATPRPFEPVPSEYGVVPLVVAPAVVAAIIAGGATVATTGASVAMQIKGHEDAMRAQHACIRQLDRDIDHALKKMWATPIFTRERVAWEKKANALKKKRAEYLKSGCPEALALARRKKKGTGAGAAPLPETAPTPSAGGVPSWAWWGGGAALLALLGLAVAKKRREAA